MPFKATFQFLSIVEYFQCAWIHVKYTVQNGGIQNTGNTKNLRGKIWYLV